MILHSSLPHNHPTASSQPKGEEVDHLIAAALRKDPYSHITHHVNSIIARANKDYETACRSLSRAREIDPDNVPLMRDAISLHTQLGQHQESLRVRHRYFTMRPNMRSHWISLAVGHELCGNDQEALNVFLGLEESTKVSVLVFELCAAFSCPPAVRMRVSRRLKKLNCLGISSS